MTVLTVQATDSVTVGVYVYDARWDPLTRSRVSRVEVCMGMALTGIPWVPWDSHGNGNHCDSIMGMGMGIKAWEWELNNGNGNGFPLYLFSTKSTLSSCMYACECSAVLANKSMLPKLYAVARKVLCVPASSAASEGVQHCCSPSWEKEDEFGAE